MSAAETGCPTGRQVHITRDLAQSRAPYGSRSSDPEFCPGRRTGAVSLFAYHLPVVDIHEEVFVEAPLAASTTTQTLVSQWTFGSPAGCVQRIPAPQDYFINQYVDGLNLERFVFENADLESMLTLLIRMCQSQIDVFSRPASNLLVMNAALGFHTSCCTTHNWHEPDWVARASKCLYFFPLFLIPWPPEFNGPFPPALAAISFRAFSSIVDRMLARSPEDVGRVLHWVPLARTYRPSSSRGMPCHPRRDPSRPSWEPSEAWPCHLFRDLVRGKSAQKGAVDTHQLGRRHPCWSTFEENVRLILRLSVARPPNAC